MDMNRPLHTLAWGPVAFVSDTYESFARAITTSPKGVRVVTANPEMILLARRDGVFRHAFETADFRTVDGVGLAFVLKKIHGEPVASITGADFCQFLFEAWKDKPLFLLGSTPENVAAAAEALKARGVNVVGVQDGFFGDEDESRVAGAIRASGAWWLLVGMGAPRQELFLQRHLETPGVQLGLGGGGVIDLVAGKVTRAPMLWRKLKVEWLFRLLTNPSRWRRYGQLFLFLPVAFAGWRLKKPPFGPSV